MHKLFLDANVLFTAAHNPDGKAAFLFDEPNRNYWQLLTSGYAAEEARRNISIRYREVMPRLNELLAQIVTVSEPTAADGRAVPVTHILTADQKHVAAHKDQPLNSAGITIQPVTEYLAALEG